MKQSRAWRAYSVQKRWRGPAHSRKQSHLQHVKRELQARRSQPGSQSAGVRQEIRWSHITDHFFGGCGPILLFFALFIAITLGLEQFLSWIFSHTSSQGEASIFLVQGDDIFRVGQLWVAWIIVFILITAVLLIGFWTFTGFRNPTSKRARNVWRMLAPASFLAAFFAFIVVLDFWSAYFNPNVGMTRTGFLRSSVVIGDGETIHFYNPANGAVQILCVGVNQVCQSANDSSTGVALLLCDVGISQGCHLGDVTPPGLVQGLTIQPGQTLSLEFDVDGTYQITSKTTAHMNITITVNSRNGDSDP